MAKNKTRAIIECSRCHEKVSPDEIEVIDGEQLCHHCLYGGLKPFKIYPIGFVRNNLKRARTGFGTDGDRSSSCIELLDSQRPFLYRIEEEDHLTIVYYFHESGGVRSVFRRGLDGKKVGVFSSRTPYRLSRIAIQDVRLLKVEGNKLFVEGLDAVNGSPVLDIKMKWNSKE
ncbi:MAG: hypothetical protein GF409_05080 [Candidatus Omnitrophica bacterium]|nr:hypothetical protein [Candidatus Omnitrophota bacterium]